MLILFGLLWIINDWLFFKDDEYTWQRCLLETVLISGAIAIYLIITKLKYFTHAYSRVGVSVLDFIIFSIMGVICALLTWISCGAGFTIGETDGIKSFFTATDAFLLFIWTYFLLEFLVINWLYKVLYFFIFWAVVVIQRALTLPQTGSFFLEVRTMVYVFVVVLLQERSARINFIMKKKNIERIELLETVLRRVHEHILVFDLNLELKFFNILPWRSNTNIEESTKTQAETLIRTIKSLEYLDDDAAKRDFLKYPRIKGKEMTLEDYLKEVAADEAQYKELCDRDFITLQGKVACEDELDIELEGSLKYFKLEMYGNTIFEEKTIVVIAKEITNHILLLQKKNEIQSNLLSSLSHELKTPLGINLTLIQNALDSKEISERAKRNYLEPAINYNKMLTFFINDILDFVKIQKNEFKLNISTFCMEYLISEILELLAPALTRKNLTLDIDFDESKRTIIRSDSERIRQILLNLLSNAIKYTMSGSIKLRIMEMDYKTYVIGVKDSGIGLGVKELEVLRKKLDSKDFGIMVNKNSTGAGIGLIISNVLAKHLDPRGESGLKVESELNCGSDFSFMIKDLQPSLETQTCENVDSSFEPNCEDEESEHANVTRIFPTISSSRGLTTPINLPTLETLPSQRPSKTHIYAERIPEPLPSQRESNSEECKCHRVLVVDDEIFNIVALESICKSVGFTVESAFNGAQALELISKRMREPCGEKCKIYSLVIMDCNMPIMDGYEATKEIRRRIEKGIWKELVIVGCTAYEGSDKLEKCMKVGMNMVVRKPLDKSKLIYLLKRYLAS